MLKKHDKEILGDVIWKLPGSPVVRTPHFHCRGYRFDPWLGTKIPQAMQGSQLKKRGKEKTIILFITALNTSGHKYESNFLALSSSLILCRYTHSGSYSSIKFWHCLSGSSIIASGPTGSGLGPLGLCRPQPLVLLSTGYKSLGGGEGEGWSYDSLLRFNNLLDGLAELRKNLLTGFPGYYKSM